MFCANSFAAAVMGGILRSNRSAIPDVSKRWYRAVRPMSVLWFWRLSGLAILLLVTPIDFTCAAISSWRATVVVLHHVLSHWIHFLPLAMCAYPAPGPRLVITSFLLGSYETYGSGLMKPEVLGLGTSELGCRTHMSMM